MKKKSCSLHAMALGVTLMMALGLSGCSPEQNEDLQLVNEKLSGYWEAVHYKCIDGSSYKNSDGTWSDFQYDPLEEYDITSDSEEYAVLYFNSKYNTLTFVAVGDPEMENALNIPIGYHLGGSAMPYMLQTVAFSADFANCMYIEELTDDKLVLFLNDDGEDGTYRQEYREWTTLRRVRQ